MELIVFNILERIEVPTHMHMVVVIRPPTSMKKLAKSTQSTVQNFKLLLLKYFLKLTIKNLKSSSPSSLYALKLSANDQCYF